MNISQCTNRKGFTLLETLASIAILTLTIIGPLTVIMGSSTYARQTKDVMAATYLSEEAVELLQNQYDSLYVFCVSNPSDPFCAPDGTESVSQTAWRLFKNRLEAVDSYPSCYLDDNVDGCAFDYIDMSNNATQTPARYIAGESDCAYLIGMSQTIQGYTGDGDGTATTYVCKGVVDHVVGQSTGSSYTRKITIEQIPASFESGLPVDNQYNDDLRVNASVTFRGANGVPKTVAITRFFHARP